MSKRQILFVAAFLIFIGLGYYFIPKTMIVCGSTLPIQCEEYRCEKGLIYKPSPIGGGYARCFWGGAATHIDISGSTN
ncbi:MAG: hypothetical protein A2675_00760 [Candidatus Yonathbacteria bacterium RIFCSPHIGHO2_01_FULL_51_10]|uniref:Uncharacterized protein n=1 Tax=Candidatus Yonathbacteria bacterium RIFCSPHIGHO2_01_FULL_51_10 TaxID=1802723 RepID=A0A1G2S8U0_9BACT|nr:MAG: hypothetical protein A2675_00760 [Candidatus Yonathbacteria bacterium RIFCSPHIGHO2_01_FULL_51_10]